MKESDYQKRSTKKLVKIILSGHPDQSDEDKVDRLIEIQLNKHGWYKLKW